MGIIRIIANGIELDYKRESLRVKKENNAFITDFKASHSTFPFLIVENANTKRALGTRDITSVRKKNVVPVTVLEQGNRYYGELQILSYMSGFRKCNLKYGSDLLKIMGKKLSELLPSVSIIPGETNPVPFTEEAINVVPGYSGWNLYPLVFAGKFFPEVNYQFPELAWKGKFFDEAPAAEDEWFSYRGYHNKWNRNPDRFADNSFSVSGDNGQIITIFNRQVPSPQLFLLSILKLAIGSAGYTIAGDFTETEFIRRLMVLSTKDNLCKVPIVAASQTLTFANFPYLGLFVYDFYQFNFVPEAAGTYTFTYRIRERMYPGGITTENHRTMLVYKTASGNAIDETTVRVYQNTNDPAKRLFEGTFSISVDNTQIGDTLKVQWLRWGGLSGTPEEFEMKWSNESKTFNMMHPTIPLGRYAPDWSLSQYMNEIKKLFCLDITMDDQTRVVHFNYTNDLLRSGTIHNVKKSMALSEYTPPSYNAVMLRYGNDQDNFLYIDSSGAQLNRKEESDLVLDIESKFKLVAHDSRTSDISQAEDKDGVGLMIYDPGNFAGFQVPVTSTDYNGQMLEIDGTFGIYNIYWRQVIQYRINASTVQIEGPFTESEIGKMLAIQKIFIDNQGYVITSLEYNETVQDNYMVKLQLESVTL